MKDNIGRSGPTIKKGKSKQDYETPLDLIEAVVRRFGPIAFDLAADAKNAKAEKFYSIEDDSLSKSWWELSGNLWLNPPFANIEPWANRCAITSLHGNPANRILFLVPASVGSEWFANHVHDKAYVLSLRPRVTFVGCKDPFPKDLMLAVYGSGFRGFDTWRWKP